MKKSEYLINICGGGTANEKEQAEALKTGQIAGRDWMCSGGNRQRR